MDLEFEVDEGYRADLEWADEFVAEEVEPLDLVLRHAWDMQDPLRQELVPPLQDRVRARGLWATNLGPELGGPGHGQVKLALLHEVLGRSHSAPIVFGCQAPDSGNAEILAHYGSAALRERYLAPLLAGQVVSCFSMTEPQGGSDPTQFTTAADRDGDEWVINGEKWFSSHANFASFLIVLAVTSPDAGPHSRMSMFVVPTDTPGIEIVRNVSVYGRQDGGVHSYVRYHDVRVPADHMLGPEGAGFEVAQVRLGGGRVHHAMRCVGLVKRALEMMCERALSRHTKGEPLSRKQLVQEMIAESWIELEQFRLLVLRTAARIDRYGDYRKVRGDISAVKVAMPKVLRDVASRALQVHGALGASDEMPFGRMVMESFHLSLADGATEVHKVTLAREVLRGYEGTDDLFPTRHIPRLRARAEAKYADALARHGRTPTGGGGPAADA
ncbi:MAG: acyl-CoA dehydrogenase family protein [Acidimicrobiia bacterium]